MVEDFVEDWESSIRRTLEEIKAMPPLERFAALDLLEAEISRAEDEFRQVAIAAWNEWWDGE